MLLRTLPLFVMSLLAACAALTPASPADAQQLPGIEEGEPLVRHVTVPGGAGIQLYDARDNTLVFDGSYDPVFAPGSGLEIESTIQPQPTGFDLILSCRNPTTAPIRLRGFALSSFRLGRNVQYRDFRFCGSVINADYLTYTPFGYVYPNDFYSPVFVISNSRYLAGVSIQYPVLDYQHDVEIVMMSPGADLGDFPGRGWLIEFAFGARDGADESILPRAYVPPGATWTYVISVRLTTNHAEWIRTLVPYRNFFRDLYGGVRYQRDPRPVLPVTIALVEAITPSNPAGFSWGNDRRPDVFGWRPWATVLSALRDDWPRMMLWGPSGVYDADRTLNYPFQFTSRWMDDPETALATDPVEGLPPLAAAGVDFGLWWGRCGLVARRWNPTSAELEYFNPDDPEHVALAFQELDLAAATGATIIGLDAYGWPALPGWKRYRWMETMRARHPRFRFCTERINSDLVHLLAPTFLPGWNTDGASNASELYPIQSPHYLADFIVPGHEIWIGFNYRGHRQLGIAVTPELLEQDAARFASWGYVPVLFETFHPSRQYPAAESWRYTVPADLQQSPQWNTNFDRARTTRGADGRLQIIAGEGPGEPDSAPAAPVREPGTEPKPEDPPTAWMTGDRSAAAPVPAGAMRSLLPPPATGRAKAIAAPQPSVEPASPVAGSGAAGAPPQASRAAESSIARLLALPGLRLEGRTGVATAFDPQLVKAAIERARMARTGAHAPR
jgi:hypothetical protein